MLIDLILLVLALVFGPAMVYEMWASRKRARGDDVPTLAEIGRALWVVAGPWAELLGYGIKRLIAFNWTPTDADLPRLLRLDDDGDDILDAPAPGVAAAPAPAAAPAADGLARLRSDRSRAAVVAALVAAGWDVGQIRAVVKGDNGVIGAEVAAARASLGAAAPPARVFMAREHVNGVRIERPLTIE